MTNSQCCLVCPVSPVQGSPVCRWKTAWLHALVAATVRKQGSHSHNIQISWSSWLIVIWIRLQTSPIRLPHLVCRELVSKISSKTTKKKFNLLNIGTKKEKKKEKRQWLCMKPMCICVWPYERRNWKFLKLLSYYRFHTLLEGTAWKKELIMLFLHFFCVQ